MKFTIILEPQEEEGYTTYCPALPGCVSQGNTLDEAMDTMSEFMVFTLAMRRQEGYQIPHETADIIGQEITRILRERSDAGLSLTIETREVEFDLP